MTTAAVQELRTAGLRATQQRIAALDAVRGGSHVDADTVIQRVRGQLGHVSTQAVYDALHALTRAGLVRCIQPAGSPARYDMRVGDNHHHLVCRDCGVIQDVDCAIGQAPCLEPAARYGFVVDEAEVTYWGRCADCQEHPQ